MPFAWPVSLAALYIAEQVENCKQKRGAASGCSVVERLDQLAVLVDEEFRGAAVGRQRLAGELQHSAERLQRDHLARGRLVLRLRLRQLEDDRRRPLLPVHDVAARLQAQAVGEDARRASPHETSNEENTIQRMVYQLFSVRRF